VKALEELKNDVIDRAAPAVARSSQR